MFPLSWILVVTIFPCIQWIKNKKQMHENTPLYDSKVSDILQVIRVNEMCVTNVYNGKSIMFLASPSLLCHEVDFS